MNVGDTYSYNYDRYGVPAKSLVRIPRRIALRCI